MAYKYLYLVCKKTWWGGVKPIRICTSATWATSACGKGEIILRQSSNGPFEEYVPTVNQPSNVQD